MSERYKLERNPHTKDLRCWDVVDTQARPTRVLAEKVLGADGQAICAALNKKIPTKTRRKDLEAVSS